MLTYIRDLFREVARTHGIEGVDFSEPRGDFYQANGIRFHYLDWGGSGYPIVFLHGNLQSANTWDLIAVQLRNTYHCYGLDQRNHGETDRVRDGGGPNPSPGGNNRAAMIEDVKAFVDHLGLKEFFLVGMSMGGGNAMGFINKYSQGIKALTLVDVTPGVGGPVVVNPNARPETDRPNFRFLNEFDSLEQAVDLAMKANPGRPRVHLEYTLTNSLKQSEDGKWVWKRPRLEPLAPPSRQPPTPEQVARQREVMEQQWEDLKRIAVPTLLVLGGDSDRTNQEQGVRFAQTVKGSRVITVPRASHNVQGDQPKVLAAHLGEFLETVEMG